MSADDPATTTTALLAPAAQFNEPGYESTLGTPKGDAESFRYNSVIREATIKYAMIDHLKNLGQGGGSGGGQNPAFRSTIALHFLHRRDSILLTVKRWVAEAGKSQAQGYMDHLQRLTKLEADLGALLKAL